MNIKKYLEDKVFLIVVFSSSTVFLILTLYLEANRAGLRLDRGNILYAFFLAFTIGGIGLAYDYFRKRKTYKVLEDTIKEGPGDIFKLEGGLSNEKDLYRQAIESIYFHQEERLSEYERQIRLNQDFTNLWIHQMKTPVSVINLLLEKGDVDRNTLKNIEEEINKISNGLDLALYNLRLQDFNLDFRVEKIDLNQLVRDIINKNKNNFIINSVFPRMEGVENFYITSDRKWLGFIIEQIIQNSIKYTKVKNIEGKKVLIRLSENEKESLLIIEDNGVGIAEQDLARVFNPFFTGENGRNYTESTGMGLYLVKSVLDELGHSIEIESEEDSFTRVKIIFPKKRHIYSLDN